MKGLATGILESVTAREMATVRGNLVGSLEVTRLPAPGERLGAISLTACGAVL